jgi:hypothetical protein
MRSVAGMYHGTQLADFGSLKTEAMVPAVTDRHSTSTGTTG